LSASGVGYYGFQGDNFLDENDGPGYDFLARLASAWEQTAVTAEKFGARVVLCRIGIVLGRNGGALARLTTLFKCYLGASLGSGKQWFSWIHEQDLTNIFLFLLEHPEVKGPVNFTAPHPVRNRELTQALSAVLHKPSLRFPVPEFFLRLALGESADMLLKGQRALPQKLLSNGFLFKFPTLSVALHDLLAQN
jgi:Predicted nucleoside-diphosphate sugar epimerase